MDGDLEGINRGLTKYCIGFHLEGLRKATKSFNQDIRCLDRAWTLTSLE
jgi:hypothetical protein